MTTHISSNILLELGKNDFLSNHEILRRLKNKRITRQNLKYYLDKFVELKIIRKIGINYQLIRKTFIINGRAIIEFDNKLLFLDCPYYGSQCTICKDNHLEQKCMYTEELPEFLKKRFE